MLVQAAHFALLIEVNLQLVAIGILNEAEFFIP